MQKMVIICHNCHILPCFQSLLECVLRRFAGSPPTAYQTRGEPLAFHDEELRAARAQLVYLALGQELGLGAAYRAFRLAAEFEDRAEILRSAAWQVVGRTIIVALSLPQLESATYIENLDAMLFRTDRGDAGAFDHSLFAAAPQLKPHARRIASNLDILLGAGRAGGSIASTTISIIAHNLSDELGALLSKVDQLLSPGAAQPPRVDLSRGGT